MLRSSGKCATTEHKPRTIDVLLGGSTGVCGSLKLTEAAAAFLDHCEPLRQLSELIALPSTLDESKAQIGRILRPLRTGTHPLRMLAAIDWLFESHEDFVDQHLHALHGAVDAGCLPDFPGTVAFVGLGNAVSLASSMPWMQGVPVLYWGDIDTHGFSILARARRVFGNVTSTLMDETTLKVFLDRSTLEPVQSFNADVANLSPGEATVYRALLSGDWGRSLRLEQERIDWAYCELQLRRNLN